MQNYTRDNLHFQPVVFLLVEEVMMAIEKAELEKEKLILTKVRKLLEETLNDLGKDVYQEEEDFVTFKKMVWSDSHSFDEGDLKQAMAATSEEGEKILRKQNYFKRLQQIKTRPYFASLVFQDENKTIYTIYMALTYLKDKRANNILYDWRSPICSLFYDYETGPCQYQAPFGICKGELLRKRQYRIEEGQLIGVFDTSLNIDDELLQDVLASESSEKMKQVVNTIQQEQNEIIRNLDDHHLIVQGIAGSGKTTVALHRIAFLLYRLERLSSKNILIFSPNGLFTEYISDVLPSLGEENTLQTTFHDYLSYTLNEYKEIESFPDFIARFYTGKETNIELVTYKQSDIIIEQLDAYLESYVRSCQFTSSFVENTINKVDKKELNDWLHNKYDRFPLFERVELIALKLSEKYYKGTKKKLATFRKLLRENASFTNDYKKIYKGFFLSEYCSVVLSESEVNHFINSTRISYEDALLFTYMKGILEGFPYEANIKQVVVDEAQDYNYLQYLIMTKIFRKASFTIVGDIYQNINPYYRYQSLEDLKPLFKGSSRYLELRKTYRSSPPIIDYTNKILSLQHVNAIRRDNDKPVVIRKNITSLKTSLLNDISYLQKTYQSVAIITKESIEAEKLYNLLKEDVLVSLLTQDSKAKKAGVIVIPAYLAKGLEFDSVIIYNDRLHPYKKSDRNLLYVACTRAQHELYIYN